MATARLINIEEAKLKTLSVQIAALTVSGKQMTLSTFRQLPEASIWSFADTPESAFAFQGVPWGRVRYAWGGQRADGWWLVWQDDAVLYRDFHPDWRKDTAQSATWLEFIKRADSNASHERSFFLSRLYDLEEKIRTNGMHYMRTAKHDAELRDLEQRLAVVSAALADIEELQQHVAKVVTRAHDMLLALPQLFIAV